MIGSFEFRSVAAGNYRVMAFADVEFVQSRDPELIRVWIGKGAEVKAVAKETKIIPLTAPRTK